MILVRAWFMARVRARGRGRASGSGRASVRVFNPLISLWVILGTFRSRNYMSFDPRGAKTC